MDSMIGKTNEGVVIEVLDRFGHILPSTIVNKDVFFAPDDIALRRRADSTGKGIEINVAGAKDKTTKYSLDFINVWLEDVSFSWKRQRTAIARTGIYIPDPVTGKNIMYKAVPSDMTYAITFWTAERIKMDKFVEEFMFWQQDNPNIDLFYDDNKPLEMDVIVHPAVERDDSKIVNMYKEGKYWKHTIYITVEAWIIKGLAVKTARTIILDIYAKMSSGGEIPDALVSHSVITSDRQLNILYVVADKDNLNEDEINTSNYLMQLGHTVTCLTTITRAIVDTYDIMLLSESVKSVDYSTISPAIAPTATTILMQAYNGSLGFGSGTEVPLASHNIEVINNNHYITLEYATGEIVLVDEADVALMSGSVWRNVRDSLLATTVLTAEENDGVAGGVGRRGIFGMWKIGDATDAGKNLFKRLIEWGGYFDKMTAE